MRAISETLNDAKGLVDKIYENMSTVETCEAIREKIQTMRVCYTGDGINILALDKVLSEDQMQETSKFIIAMLDKRRDDAARYLDFLNGKVPAIPNPVFEAAVDEMVNQAPVEEVPEVPKKKSYRQGTGVKPEDVQKLLNDGMPTGEITKKLGVKQPRISQIIRDNNLVNPNNKKKKKPEVLSKEVNSAKLEEFLSGRIEEIKALYTSGPFTLKKLADEYSCDVKILHEFLVNHGLLKQPKKDPFKGK